MRYEEENTMRGSAVMENNQRRRGVMKQSQCYHFHVDCFLITEHPEGLYFSHSTEIYQKLNFLLKGHDIHLQCFNS